MLRKYRNQRIVLAGKIFQINYRRMHAEGATLFFELNEGDDDAIDPADDAVHVGPNYLDSQNPKLGGYYMRYENGAEFFKTAEEFEAKYTMLPLDPDPAPDPDAVTASSSTLLDRGQCMIWELSDLQLEKLVAKAANIPLSVYPKRAANNIQPDGEPYWPVKNWLQAGQIIQEHKISLRPTWLNEPGDNLGGTWRAFANPDCVHEHQNPLRAAMLAFVASKMGSTVNIPE